MHTDPELAQKERDAEPMRLHLLAFGWTNVRWTHEPHTRRWLKGWTAYGTFDGVEWSGVSPVSPTEALISMRDKARGSP